MPHSTDHRTVRDLSRQLELVGCLACGQVGEVTGTFELPAPDGTPERYVRSRCLDGHVVVVPAFAVQA